MPVHPSPAAVAQDRPADPAGDGLVDGSPDRLGQRDQDNLGALAGDSQDAVTVFLAEVGDVGGGGWQIRRPSSPSVATKWM